MKLFARLMLVLSLLTVMENITHAQDIFKSRDLTKISVDALSDEEILRYRSQLRESGVSEIQAEQLAIQRGLPSSELIKLKARIARLENLAKNKTSRSPVQRTLDTATIPLIRWTEPTVNKSRIFGSEIFNTGSVSLIPQQQIATPKNYTLGPGDELLIDVYGYQEVNYRLTVSPEGTIVIPYVGVIPVSGITIENATTRIRDRMKRNGYASLGTGQSKLEITVGRIKSINITIIGEASKPGSYTLSSLSNIFNALYAAGGINERGSFRQIQLIRNNRVVDSLDAYDYLLRGDLSHNSGLMDQDVIRVPVADILVEVKGEVKRTGIFEILPRENMNDLVRFTGGFTNEAYTASIHIQQVTDKERKLKDLSKDQFSSFGPKRGDIVIIDKILDQYTNRVIIRGAVSRPGPYELTEGLTLSQLITRAEGLREDAFKERVILVRTREDLTAEYIPVQLSEVMSGVNDIKLKKEDYITVASIFDYKENYSVTIEGEVRKPGVYKYVENITLKDLLFQSGGLTDAAAPQQIEIARRLNSDTTSAFETQIAQVIDVNSQRELLFKGEDIKLSPWDIVMVRTKLGYKPQVSVRLEGEVLYPGIYILQTKGDRISDMVKRAGGLTPYAYMQGAYLSRINYSGIEKDANIERIKKIQQQTNDTSNAILEDVTKPLVKIGLDLQKILQNPHSSDDIILQEGDVLNISKETFEVKINGEVMFPTQVVFKEGEDLRYYIDKAGGFTDYAVKKRTYILYANGNAAKTRKFLFFKRYPRVKAGAEILIPKKLERNRQHLSTGELIGLTSGLATLLTLIVTLSRL